MRLQLISGLPFVSLTVGYQGASLVVEHVLVDTGSVSTLLAADIVAELGLVPAPDDILHMVRGVGGTEVVFTRRVESLQLGELTLPDVEVEIGAMDYGFAINGILGMDVLRQAGAVLNLRELTLTIAA